MDLEHLIQRYEVLSGHEACWDISTLEVHYVNGRVKVAAEGIYYLTDRDAQGNTIITQVVWDDGKTTEEIIETLADIGLTLRLSKEDHLVPFM